MTVAAQMVEEVFARLREEPPLLPGNMERVRRTQLSPPTSDGAPAVYVIQGDESRDGERADCRHIERLAITVSIFARADDDALPAADALRAEVHRRLDPMRTDRPYPAGGRLVFSAARTEQAVADQMPVRIDLEYSAVWSGDGWEL